MENKQRVLAEYWDLFNKKTWLDGYKMKEKIKEYKPSEVHCIDYIGNNEEPNVTKLAGEFYMTRGAISKLTKKMISKDLIESYQKSDNKKEVYFRLTKKGRAIFEMHENFHKEIEHRDKIVFEQVSQEEINTMLRFANIYNRHLDKEIAKLGLDMKSAGYDKM